MSAHGRELLAEWEDVKLHSYLDATGNPTIGVGHMIRYDEERNGALLIGDRRVPYRDGITREDAMELLAQDLGSAEAVVSERVIVPLEQCQFDALCSFTFNTGTTHFIDSTLLRCVNERNFEAVPQQILRWVYSKGEYLPGLVNRRNNEVALWEGRL